MTTPASFDSLPDSARRVALLRERGHAKGIVMLAETGKTSAEAAAGARLLGRADREVDPVSPPVGRRAGARGRERRESCRREEGRRASRRGRPRGREVRARQHRLCDRRRVPDRSSRRTRHADRRRPARARQPVGGRRPSARGVQPVAERTRVADGRAGRGRRVAGPHERRAGDGAGRRGRVAVHRRMPDRSAHRLVRGLPARAARSRDGVRRTTTRGARCSRGSMRGGVCWREAAHKSRST